ncbi:LytR/AlgR family response regulator transcription factor [Dyadobacter diqingensis]|uniref:LytR/AlgR family response regulator transcription factor n=1 Tax=Dyadobacter diqingensis TaxID=2938121 RepID=UPI0020C1A02B|nr:LytTR family DNA-binding domain-containing protein [Dyadobacter diqingensis]
MNIRCLIVDDEPLAHDVILNYISEVPFLEVAGQCYRATEALNFLHNDPVDLIFLDIRMPKLSGLDFIKTLQKRPIIIITSAYEAHALESFDLDVCDYLLKPFRFERFLKAANRALSTFNSQKQMPNVEVAPSLITAEPTQIYIKSDKKYILQDLDKIYYLESLGNYVKIWDDEKFWLTPRTLTSFESQLSSETFIRVHKSFIANRAFVHYIEGNTIFLRNGKQLPLGKNYRHVVKLLFGPI